MSIFFSYEHICTCDIPVISSSCIEPQTTGPSWSVVKMLAL